MNAFLWTMVVVFGVGILGKACMLHQQDRVRNLALLPWDIAIEVGLLAWAVYLIK